jgi:hypothetical protein
VIVHTCNLNTWEAKARGLLYIEGQPGLARSRLDLKKKKKKKRNTRKIDMFLRFLEIMKLGTGKQLNLGSFSSEIILSTHRYIPRKHG